MSRRRLGFGGLFLAGMMMVCLLAPVNTAMAEVKSEGAGSTNWNQRVELHVELTNAIMSIDIESPLAGSGTSTNPYITRNQNVTLIVQLIGRGILTIVDKDDNVVGTYEKVDPDEETVTFEVVLDEIGDYDFFGTYVDPMDPLRIFNQRQVFVTFELTPIPPIPNPPQTGTPGTGLFGGVVYIGGYALPTMGLVFWFAVVLGIGFGVMLLCRHRRRLN